MQRILEEVGLGERDLPDQEPAEQQRSELVS